MKERHQDWQTALLFLMVMILASGRLVMTGWTQNLIMAQAAAILGGALGLGLAASQFSEKTRRWLALAYSPFVLTWLLLQLSPGAESLLTRLASLAGRLWFALGQLVNAEEINDPLLFVAFCSLGFWLVGIFSGQAILQPGRLLAGLLPSSLIIFIIQFYDGYPAGRIGIVAIYLVVVLLLIGRQNYLQNARHWQTRGIFTGPEPEFDLNRSIMLATLLIVALAWLLPTPARALPAAAKWWRENSGPIREAQERIAKALTALNSEQPPILERYGDQIVLGNRADQGEGILFRVRAPLPSLPRYYWRARIYDRYEKGNWQSTLSSIRSYLPESEDLDIPDREGRLAEFEFEWQFVAQANLLTHPQPVWVSRPGQLRYNPLEDGQLDIDGWRASPRLSPGERYLARSIVRSPTILELQEAGQEYPDWVRENYLGLPADMSPRIVALAVSITDEAQTPYEKAVLITEYLRENITYEESVPPLPLGADPLERFLFDWQRGYCTYYASAQVLMLRSVGVPARMAAGYAQGELMAGRYVVRSRDAHTWPEVYFPGIGWVEFEPTGNQPPIERPSGIQLPAAERPTPIIEREIPLMDDGNVPPAGVQSQPIGAQFPYRQVFGWIIITLLLLLSGYTLWRLQRQKPFEQRTLQAMLSYYRWRGRNLPHWLQNWQRWSSLTDIERAFHTINQALAWFKQQHPESLTPAERVQLLKKQLPQATQAITTLANEHENSLYSPHPGDPARAKKAAWQIRVILFRSIFERLFTGAAP